MNITNNTDNTDFETTHSSYIFRAFLITFCVICCCCVSICCMTCGIPCAIAKCLSDCVSNCLHIMSSLFSKISNISRIPKVLRKSKTRPTFQKYNKQRCLKSLCKRAPIYPAEIFSESCSICLEEFNNTVTSTRCKHLFHLTCMEKYIKKGGIVCPICRRVL